MGTYFRKHIGVIARAASISVLALCTGAEAATPPAGDTHYSLSFFDQAIPTQLDGTGDFWVAPPDLLGSGNAHVDLFTATFDGGLVPACGTSDCNFNQPSGPSPQYIPGEKAFISDAGGVRALTVSNADYSASLELFRDATSPGAPPRWCLITWGTAGAAFGGGACDGGVALTPGGGLAAAPLDAQPGTPVILQGGDFGVTAVPEPTSSALLAAGVIGFAVFRRRR